VTLSDALTSKTYTGTLSGSGDTLAVSIPAADLTVGTHTFSATYTGDSNYTVPTAYQSFGSQVVTVSAAPQTITFAPTITSYTYASSGTFSLSATASSGLAVSFASETPEVCSVSGTVVTILSGGTCTIEATQTGTDNYQAATPVDVNFTITSAAQTISFAPAVTSYNYSSGGTITLSATSSTGLTVSFASKSASVCSATKTTATILSAGTCTIEATQSGNASYGAATPVDVNFTIAQVTPTVALSTSSSSIVQGNTVTFTAKVSSSVGTPSGTVNFLDGTTVLGSATLASGLASFSSSSLSSGSHTITTSYLGDVNFAAATSSTLTESVVAISVTVPTSGTTSQTVEPGGTATYTLEILPSSGSSFTTALTLTLSGAPDGATLSVAPTSWTKSGSNTWTLPANTVLSGNTTLSIQLPSSTASLKPTKNLSGRGASMVLAIGLLLPFAKRLRKAGKKLRGVAISLLLLIAIVAGMTACSSQSGYFSSAPKSYTMVVTVSSGTSSQSTNLTLTVE
jgi:hypothetical protein